MGMAREDAALRLNTRWVLNSARMLRGNRISRVLSTLSGRCACRDRKIVLAQGVLVIVVSKYGHPPLQTAQVFSDELACDFLRPGAVWTGLVTVTCRHISALPARNWLDTFMQHFE